MENNLEDLKFKILEFANYINDEKPKDARKTIPKKQKEKSLIEFNPLHFSNNKLELQSHYEEFEMKDDQKKFVHWHSGGSKTGYKSTKTDLISFSFKCSILKCNARKKVTACDEGENFSLTTEYKNDHICGMFDSKDIKTTKIEKTNIFQVHNETKNFEITLHEIG